MNEEVELYLDDAKEQMHEAVLHLEKELAKIRAGKASPQMLEGVMVEYYGALTPLSQVANVSASDARTLVIQPWEKQMINPIEKGILKANLGFTPMNNGEVVRINVPALTEERRRNLVKQAKAETETAKVRVRTTRRDTNDEFKKLKKDGLSEDVVKDAESKVQVLTDGFVKKIDDLLEKKEADIMTI